MKCKIFFVYNILLVLFIGLVICKETPKIKIPDGEIQGTIEVARNGRNYFRFLGIPYGKVDRRFENSKPTDGWNGTLDGSKKGVSCLQIDFMLNTVVGDEDCLILNIYTPQLNNEKLLPVMFFIHGGAYLCGSANEYDGSYFMSEDVVLVAINYRLGPLGFLNAGIEGASGNQGLKDQVLALKWVEKNIRLFGGDPKRVTIFGESAGAISVSHHTMSPMSKGLFHGAITQSGAITCPQSNKEEGHFEEVKKLAHLVDCPSSDVNYMIKCLRKVKGHDIIEATHFTHPTHFSFDVYNVPQFGPTIEKYKSSEGTFYDEDPLKILVDGRFNQVPLMTGITSHEGIFISANVILQNETLLELLNNEWGRIAPSTFQYHNRARDPCKLSGEIREFYFQNEEISSKNADKLIDLYSDSWFLPCTKQLALLYARHAPVYIYNFTHWGEQTFDMFSLTENSKGLKAPTHADDLIYQFPMPNYLPPLTKGSDDEDFSIKMVKLWASFATDLKPTFIWGPLKKWPELNADDSAKKKGVIEWLQLDNTLTIKEEDPEFTKRMDFWDKLMLPIQLRKLGVTLESSTAEKLCSKPIDTLIGSCSSAY